MTLRVEIPEDFEPVEIQPLKPKQGRDIQFWIYSDCGEAKSYTSANEEEVSEFAKTLYRKNPVSCGLGLLPIRALALDIGLKVAITRTRNLFGGPEYWENMPEWQRASRIFRKKEEK